MTTKDLLEANVKAAQEALVNAQAELEAWKYAPENNQFNDLDEAVGLIEDALRDRAHADCEGSHNCGNDSYTQEFIVSGVRYLGTLSCEYNRHDKTYYYLEEAHFSHAEIIDVA